MTGDKQERGKMVDRKKRSFFSIERTNMTEEQVREFYQAAARRGLSVSKWLVMLGLQDARKTRREDQ